LVLAAIGAAVLLATPALAAILPPNNPTTNRPLDVSDSPCNTTGGAQPDDSAACTAYWVGQIDNARAAEGVGLLYLPSDYAQLTGAEQEFVVLNLERVDRGIPAITGLTPALDALATQGADSETDPPLAASGSSWVGSVWASGFASTLEVDFGWMYDDGPGSPNIACPSAGDAGCWGHRDIILGDRAANMVAGAATAYGDGLTQYAAELEQPTAAPPVLVYTWAEAVAAGAGEPSRPTGWPVPVRVAGVDRVATAISISQSTFASLGDAGVHAGAVVLARDDAFPDALAAAPLAAADDAPVLLTPPSSLDPRVTAEIGRILGPGGDVYLIGGDVALAPGIAQTLTAAGYTVTRIAGSDRFSTAVAIADTLGDPTTVFEADGDNFADALAAGPAAALEHGVVLLTDGPNMPAATAAYVANHLGTHYAIGGPAAQADLNATDVVGADRYATAADVATSFFTHPATVGFATGLDYPDALAASAQLALAGSPLLLLEPNEVPAPTAAYIGSHPSVSAIVYGGTSALSNIVTSIL